VLRRRRDRGGQHLRSCNRSLNPRGLEAKMVAFEKLLSFRPPLAQRHLQLLSVAGQQVAQTDAWSVVSSYSRNKGGSALWKRRPMPTSTWTPPRTRRGAGERASGALHYWRASGWTRRAACTSMLRGLVDRGLEGVRSMVSDDHEGIKVAGSCLEWIGRGASFTSSATCSLMCRRLRRRRWTRTSPS
jgi:hypothetical protein